MKNIIKRTIATLLATSLLTTSVLGNSGSGHGSSQSPAGGSGGTAGNFMVGWDQKFPRGFALHLIQQHSGTYWKDGVSDNPTEYFNTNSPMVPKNRSGVQVAPIIYMPGVNLNNTKELVTWAQIKSESGASMHTFQSHGAAGSTNSRGTTKVVFSDKSQASNEIEKYIMNALPDTMPQNILQGLNNSSGVDFGNIDTHIKNLGITDQELITLLKKTTDPPKKIKFYELDYKADVEEIYIERKDKEVYNSGASRRLLGTSIWMGYLAKGQGLNAEEVVKNFMLLPTQSEYVLCITEMLPIYFINETSFSGVSKGGIKRMYVPTTLLVNVAGLRSNKVKSNLGIAKVPYLNTQNNRKTKGSETLENFLDAYASTYFSNANASLDKKGRNFSWNRNGATKIINGDSKEIYPTKYPQSAKENGAILGFNIIPPLAVSGPPPKVPVEGTQLQHSITATISETGAEGLNYDKPIKSKAAQAGINSEPIVGVNFKPILTKSSKYQQFKTKVLNSAKEYFDFVDKLEVPMYEDKPTIDISFEFFDIDAKITVTGAPVTNGKLPKDSSPTMNGGSLNTRFSGNVANSKMPASLEVSGRSLEDLSRSLDRELAKAEKFLSTRGILQVSPNADPGTTVSLDFLSEGKYNFKMDVDVDAYGEIGSKFDEFVKENNEKAKEEKKTGNYSEFTVLPTNSRVWVDLDKSNDHVEITYKDEALFVNWWSNPQSYGEFKNESSGHKKPHAWDVFQGIPHDRNVELNLGNSPFAVNVGAAYQNVNLQTTISYNVGNKSLSHGSCSGENCHPPHITNYYTTNVTKQIGPGQVGFWNITDIQVSVPEQSTVSGTLNAKTQAQPIKVFEDVRYDFPKLNGVNSSGVRGSDFPIRTDITDYVTINNGHEYKLRVLRRSFSGDKGTNPSSDSYGFSSSIHNTGTSTTPQSSDTSQNAAEITKWAESNYWFVNSDGLSFELYQDGKRIQILDVLEPYSALHYFQNGSIEVIPESNPPSKQFSNYYLEKVQPANITSAFIDWCSGTGYTNYSGGSFDIFDGEPPIKPAEVKRLWKPNDITKPADPVGENSLSEEGDIYKVLWSHNHTIPVIGYQGMQTQAPYVDNNKSYVLQADGISFTPVTDVKSFYKIWQLGNPIVQNDHYSFNKAECKTTYTNWSSIYRNDKISGMSISRPQDIENYEYLDTIRNKNWKLQSVDKVLNKEDNTINPIIIHTPVSTTGLTITGDNNNNLPDQRLNRVKQGNWYGKDLETAFHEYSNVYISDDGPVPRTTIDRTYTIRWTTRGNYDQEGYKDDMPNGKEEFYRSDMVSNSGDYVGLSYSTNMETNSWIKEQYVLIPFHHVINGTYYKAGTIHKKAPTDTTLTFTIAPNQTDLQNATISVYAVAKNAPDVELVKTTSLIDSGQLGVIDIGKADVQAFTTTGQHHTNDVNDVRSNGSSDARHHSYTQLRHDIVGRIGNLNVDEVEDPNYQKLYRKQDKYTMQSVDIFNNSSKPQGANNTTQSTPHHTSDKMTALNLPVTNQHIGKDTDNLPKIGYGVGFNFQTIGSYWAENIYIKPNFLIDGNDVETMYQKLSTTKKEKIYKTLNSEFWVKHNLGSQYQKYDINDRLYHKEQGKLMKINRNVAKIMNLGNATKLTLSKEHNRLPILNSENILSIPRGTDSTVARIDFAKASSDEVMTANNHSRWVGKFNLPSSTEVYDSNGKKYPLNKPLTFEANITTGIPAYIIPPGTDGYHIAPDWVLNLSPVQPNTTAPDSGDGSPQGPINPPGTPENSRPSVPVKPNPDKPEVPTTGTKIPGPPNKIIIWNRRLTSADDLTNVGTH